MKEITAKMKVYTFSCGLYVNQNIFETHLVSRGLYVNKIVDSQSPKGLLFIYMCKHMVQTS